MKYHISAALTPLDGRNRNKLISLTSCFSDLIINKHRIRIETMYLKKLSEYKVIRPLSLGEISKLDSISTDFNEKEYEKVRSIELETNHEMKAVERYIQNKLKDSSLKDIVEMVHFGLTTDDINNIAYNLMIKNAITDVLTPELEKILSTLKKEAKKYKRVTMLSRTHGQPAVPTTVGKEYLIYYKRLKEEVGLLKRVEFRAKLTGNVGNLNAHRFIFPKINWLVLSRDFIGEFGLTEDLVTTQIEPYDSLIRVFQTLSRINNILKGLCVDFWIYITLGYFGQKVIKNEVGSTALPHKVNPIYFEGAEGGFGIANSLLNFYSEKLSHSRLQRDLSDSTVRRSVPIALSYSLLSYQSVFEALQRISPAKEKIRQDLESHYEVLSEAIQNLLRVKGYKDAYEKTKLFFRGRRCLRSDVKKFVTGLKITSEDKKTLLELTTENYTGYSEELVDLYTK